MSVKMNREILRLAVPNILSNISIPLLGMVDTALMGRLESAVFLGAVALGSILFNFIYWGFGFLRMGTTGLTAQAFGRSDRQEGIAILARGLMVAAIGSLLIIVLQGAIAWLGFSLIPGDESVKQLAKQYFYIRIYAAPATLALYVIQGWFLGMQNARYPMVLMVVINLVNILFNIFFVYQLGMKSDGVALGTVFAQYIGLGLAVGLFLRSYRSYLRFYDRKRMLNMDSLKLFISVNADIFIRTICLVFTFAFFTAASSALDSLTLAANQILLQYIALMSYGVDGFAFAAESLVGKYLGRHNLSRLKMSVRWLFLWGCSFGAAFSLIYALFGKALLRIFTNLQSVIEAASPFILWMAVVPLFGAIAYMWDGVYIGATATQAMRNMMLLATVCVFLPVYYLSVGPLGNHGLWLAMTLFMAARGVSLSLLAGRYVFRRLSISPHTF